MDSRLFAQHIGETNELWLSRLLNIPRNPCGIDLLDDLVGIEVKSRINTHARRFAIHRHQYEEFPTDVPSHELYWAFILYELDTTPREIDDPSSLEPRVVRRDVRIVPWNFIAPLPVSDCKTGRYSYVHFANLPSYTKKTEGTWTVSLPEPLSLRLKRNP